MDKWIKLILCIERKKNHYKSINRNNIIKLIIDQIKVTILFTDIDLLYMFI